MLDCAACITEFCGWLGGLSYLLDRVVCLLVRVVGLVNLMLFLLDGKGCCMVGANTM